MVVMGLFLFVGFEVLFFLIPYLFSAVDSGGFWSEVLVTFLPFLAVTFLQSDYILWLWKEEKGTARF